MPFYSSKILIPAFMIKDYIKSNLSNSSAKFPHLKKCIKKSETELESALPFMNFHNFSCHLSKPHTLKNLSSQLGSQSNSVKSQYCDSTIILWQQTNIIKFLFGSSMGYKDVLFYF